MSEEETAEKRGVIEHAEAQGGLMVLVVKDAEGKLHRLVGDNGPTVRALMAMLGNDIVSGHTLLVDRVKGVEIGYAMTEWGTLEYITE